MSDKDHGASSGGNGENIRRRVERAGEVFDRYGNEIRAMIDFSVKDKARADDIFQDLFVSVVKNPIPPKVENVQAYLYRAIANDVVDRFRRTQNHQEAVQIYTERRKQRAVQKDPQKVVAQAEEAAGMVRLIGNHLARREATALVQRCGFGLSTSDTACQLNIDKRSVSRYLAEAMKKMRNLASGNGGDAG
jgi:RNA polymerase sigma factor (sigma-70 family)